MHRSDSWNASQPKRVMLSLLAGEAGDDTPAVVALLTAMPSNRLGSALCGLVVVDGP